MSRAIWRAHSPIGRSLRSASARHTASLLAILIIAVDMLVPYRDSLRPALFAIGLAGFIALGGWDSRSLGLRLAAQPSWRFWLRVTAVLGLVGLVLVVAVVSVAALTGLKLEILRIVPRYLPWWLWHSCVKAPLLEEAVYRFVLCTAAMAAVGWWGTIILSGVVFAGLHVVYGNPSPDNAIAGFILGWAYLRSGSILVPIALHAAGNLFVTAVALGIAALGLIR